MSKKSRKKAKKLIKQANVLIPPEMNVNLGIGNNIVRKKPEMETWPDLTPIKL